MKNIPSRIAAVLLLAGGTALLTGCQAGTPVLDRTLDVTSLPTPASPVPATSPAKPADQTMGLDLHFGGTSFGLNCATDSVSTGTNGTTAVECSWKTSDR
ncbi:hypothetical protein GCM10023063_16060 [Arthrobacter methylotrophus]|uniref:Uncharacterized protein n=1 Tax=Arthrobacter methylotrophus TaxID=121291 RepID=A0ABV5URA8_9MICC